MRVTKAEILALVDRLPESELVAIGRVLDDPLLRALLSTPPDEEPLSRAEISGILDAKRDEQEGRVRRFATLDDLITELNADEQQ
jgi:hypothetical protein